MYNKLKISKSKVSQYWVHVLFKCFIFSSLGIYKQILGYIMNIRVITKKYYMYYEKNEKGQLFFFVLKIPGLHNIHKRYNRNLK